MQSCYFSMSRDGETAYRKLSMWDGIRYSSKLALLPSCILQHTRSHSPVRNEVTASWRSNLFNLLLLRSLPNVWGTRSYFGHAFFFCNDLPQIKKAGHKDPMSGSAGILLELKFKWLYTADLSDFELCPQVRDVGRKATLLWCGEHWGRAEDFQVHGIF